MKGWVDLVGWPAADGLPTWVVTRQLQVRRRTGKDRRPKTDVLPLSQRHQLLFLCLLRPRPTVGGTKRCCDSSVGLSVPFFAGPACLPGGYSFNRTKFPNGWCGLSHYFDKRSRRRWCHGASRGPSATNKCLDKHIYLVLPLVTHADGIADAWVQWSVASVIRVCVSAVCPYSKNKTTWASNTKLGRHTTHSFGVHWPWCQIDEGQGHTVIIIAPI